MRLTLIAVGRSKKGPEQELFASYQKRLRPSLELIEVEEKRRLSDAELMAREAELILAKVPEGAYVLALDERGKTMKSRDFAKFLTSEQDGGCRDMAFVIGGANGLAPEVRDRANKLMSFGVQTWPHMLVRGMLAEQLYRAQSIQAGHPYHRD